MGSIDCISPNPEIDNECVLITFHISPLPKNPLNSHNGAYKGGVMFCETNVFASNNSHRAINVRIKIPLRIFILTCPLS
jgi:hypothetical protein